MAVHRFLKLFLNSAIAVIFLAAIHVSPAAAQSAARPASVSMDPNLSAPIYDIAKEIKAQGTVTKIENVVSGGPLGIHIHIQTQQGVVDAHLGASSVARAEALGLSAGQSVAVTGMMATIGGNPVLLARILATSSHIFILRNEQGMPARSLAPRGSAASAKAVKGGL